MKTVILNEKKKKTKYNKTRSSNSNLMMKIQWKVEEVIRI